MSPSPTKLFTSRNTQSSSWWRQRNSYRFWFTGTTTGRYEISSCLRTTSSTYRKKPTFWASKCTSSWVLKKGLFFRREWLARAKSAPERCPSSRNSRLWWILFTPADRKRKLWAYGPLSRAFGRTSPLCSWWPTPNSTSSATTWRISICSTSPSSWRRSSCPLVWRWKTCTPTYGWPETPAERCSFKHNS